MKSDDFSVMLGGPLYTGYRRLGLLKPPLHFAARRIVVLIVITWLPLFVLSVLAGLAWGGVRVPFLADIAVHMRLLITLPILILAELIVHDKLVSTVKQFTEKQLISKEDEARFQSVINSGLRWRDSIIAELLILILACTLGYWLWRRHFSLHLSTWYIQNYQTLEFTLPGFWYAFVSLPIFRFIIGRWFYRLFVWHRFLWQVSRIPLRINPLHPDHAGGLGFVGFNSLSFSSVLMAFSAMFAGQLGNAILHEGKVLTDFKYEIAGYVVIFLILVLVSQPFFSPQMFASKRKIRHEFGLTAGRYVEEFRQKWLMEGSEDQKEILGSADIQSLADLGNSYSVMTDMRLIPISKKNFFLLVAVLLFPLSPLTLTMIPLAEILKRLLGILV